MTRTSAVLALCPNLTHNPGGSLAFDPGCGSGSFCVWGQVMVRRPCLGYRDQTCGVLTEGNRCRVHQRAYEQGRRPVPGARARGYDSQHDATRARLLPLAYGKPCPRCGEPMLRDQDLDLGHTVARSVDPTSRGDRIEHATCNRSAGAA